MSNDAKVDEDMPVIVEEIKGTASEETVADANNELLPKTTLF